MVQGLVGYQCRVDQSAGLTCGQAETGFSAIGIYKVPLNNDDISLAYKCVRNQGSVLKACMSLVKNANAECGHTWKPPQGVAWSAHLRCCASCEGPGHSLRSTPCSCTLQVSQRHISIVQRYPSISTAPGDPGTAFL